jgi:PTH2 family peptidyl-tRNA hydrolase
MLALKQAARSLGLQTNVVLDAGRTQIAPNTRTVLAILGEVETLDTVTGSLKLL